MTCLSTRSEYKKLSPEERLEICIDVAQKINASMHADIEEILEEQNAIATVEATFGPPNAHLDDDLHLAGDGDAKPAGRDADPPAMESNQSSNMEIDDQVVVAASPAPHHHSAPNSADSTGSAGHPIRLSPPGHLARRLFRRQ